MWLTNRHLPSCSPLHPQLMSPEPAASAAKLSVLRSCNNLLRRLSKSQDLQVGGLMGDGLRCISLGWIDQ